jgi:hypothetical protein
MGSISKRVCSHFIFSLGQIWPFERSHVFIRALKDGLSILANHRKLTGERLVLTGKHIVLLGKALKSCSPLQQMFFRATASRDDGFQAMSSSLRWELLIALGFTGCGLTDPSIGAIRGAILPLRGDRKTIKTLV